MIDALRILSLGKVPWLLQRYPEFCPGLKKNIDAAVADVQERLATGKTTAPWGEDYTEGFLSTLETL